MYCLLSLEQLWNNMNGGVLLKIMQYSYMHLGPITGEK